MKKTKVIVFVLMGVSMLFTQCSQETPTTANIKQMDDTAKIAAYPLDRYQVGPNMTTLYFTTEQDIFLRWSLSPSGCPDFQRYKVYLDGSLITTISDIDRVSYNIGEKSVGLYRWNVWAYWSFIYSDDFTLHFSEFYVEIDPSIKGPNPVGGTGHTWYVNTLSGGTFVWTVANSWGQIIYSTTNTTGSISDTNWPPHTSGPYIIQCIVTCAYSNNVYTIDRTITVSN